MKSLRIQIEEPIHDTLEASANAYGLKINDYARLILGAHVNGTTLELIPLKTASNQEKLKKRQKGQ